jgi:mono/diheme cytochrome c family protein
MKYLLALCLFALPGFAEETALTDPALIATGQQAFLDYCSACHGEEALGENGPDIQGSILKDVTMAVKGIDQMPEIWLEDGEPEAIAAFLMSLDPKVAEIKLRLEAAKRN